eukprot:COSAG04_NODE_361_length_15860_cov_18.114904_7_plen_136_part_00
MYLVFRVLGGEFVPAAGAAVVLCQPRENAAGMEGVSAGQLWALGVLGGGGGARAELAAADAAELLRLLFSQRCGQREACGTAGAGSLLCANRLHERQGCHGVAGGGRGLEQARLRVLEPRNERLQDGVVQRLRER